MNQSPNKSPQGGSTWELAREFQEGTISVVVKKQVFPKRYASDIPKSIFSFEVCHITPNGPKRFFNARTSTVNGKVGFHEVVDTAALTRLIHEAEGYILVESQMHADAVIEAMRDREQAQLDKGKQQQKPGLKALAKQDKAKREAAKA